MDPETAITIETSVTGDVTNVVARATHTDDGTVWFSWEGQIPTAVFEAIQQSPVPASSSAEGPGEAPSRTVEGVMPRQRVGQARNLLAEEFGHAEAVNNPAAVSALKILSDLLASPVDVAGWWHDPAEDVIEVAVADPDKTSFDEKHGVWVFRSEHGEVVGLSVDLRALGLGTIDASD